MAWQTIYASETDANSPLNQTLMDKIRENLDALKSGAAVTSAGLKTSVQEVSVTAVSTAGNSENIELASVGGHGFHPSVKINNTSTLSDAGARILSGTDDLATSYKTLIWLSVYPSGVVTRTLYAQVRYVQASRDEPVVWIKRDAMTKQILASVFDPEANGQSHPFEKPADSDAKDYEYLCIELKNNAGLRKHLFENFAKIGGFLEQVHIGLFTGAIKLKEDENNIVPRLSENDAPCLHHPQVKVLGFEFDKSSVKGDS